MKQKPKTSAHLPASAVQPSKPKNPAAVALGRLGGQVTGPSKSRGTLKARRAARARWDRVRAAQKLTPPTQKISPHQ